MKILRKSSGSKAYQSRYDLNLDNINYMRTYQPKRPDDIPVIASAVLDKAEELLNYLDPLPHLVSPTLRGSIQFEWELDDESYLEFELFEDNITCMRIPKNWDRTNAWHEADIPFDDSEDHIQCILDDFIFEFLDSKEDCDLC